MSALDTFCAHAAIAEAPETQKYRKAEAKTAQRSLPIEIAMMVTGPEKAATPQAVFDEQADLRTAVPPIQSRHFWGPPVFCASGLLLVRQALEGCSVHLQELGAWWPGLQLPWSEILR